MRDILITTIVFGSLPVILLRPDFGIMMWAWLGFMNPHRLTWGISRTFPFAQCVAIAILAGMVLTGRFRKPPVTRETVSLLLFGMWMQVTTVFALYPTDAWTQWDKVFKIQLMVFVTLMVIQTHRQLRTLVWVIALSLAFYGVKGGIFTIIRGGSERVYGPEGSFIAGNNEIGLALLMTIPLLRYLQVTVERRWARMGLTATMFLCAVAVLGTQSRGAFLGIVAMGLFLLWRSKYKVGPALLAIVFIPIGLSIMPQTWFDRMNTIRTYEQDSSATGRLNSWRFAFNLASDRPLLGGGFETFRADVFAIYAPEPERVADAHSIYFEVLGEHGFVGLGLFVFMGVSLWRGCSRTIKRTQDDPELEDLEHLMRMVQVSLIAYAVSGAFLGLAYFDLIYNMVAFVVIARILVDKHHAAAIETAPEGAKHPRVRGKLAARLT